MYGVVLMFYVCIWWKLSRSKTNSDFNLGILYDENEKYRYCSGFSLLDLVHIRLDLIQKTLSFTRNGTDLGIAYKNIYIAKDFGYRLAVKLKKSNCRVSIVSAHPVVCHHIHHILRICVESISHKKKKKINNNLQQK